VVPAFPGLRRFPQGRGFKQWTGDDSKALMKVYVPAIIGYVPDDMVSCLSAFLDACYITRRQEIDVSALDALDHALDRFWELREIFRTPRIRPTGFSLPRQHALRHYRSMIEDFGVPGGLCSSITESRHITAVRRPWRRSNRYHALGQMLLTNQRLDKLAAMRSNFASRGMICGVDAVGRNMPPPPSHVQASPLNGGSDEDDDGPGHAQAFAPNGGDDDDDDGGPVDEDITGHVVLARTRGMFYFIYNCLCLDLEQGASILGT
jgi:hypothetical protein